MKNFSSETIWHKKTSPEKSRRHCWEQKFKVIFFVLNPGFFPFTSNTNSTYLQKKQIYKITYIQKKKRFRQFRPGWQSCHRLWPLRFLHPSFQAEPAEEARRREVGDRPCQELSGGLHAHGSPTTTLWGECSGAMRKIFLFSGFGRIVIKLFLVSSSACPEFAPCPNFVSHQPTRPPARMPTCAHACMRAHTHWHTQLISMIWREVNQWPKGFSFKKCRGEVTKPSNDLASFLLQLFCSEDFSLLLQWNSRNCDPPSEGGSQQEQCPNIEQVPHALTLRQSFPKNLRHFTAFF